MIDMKSNFFVSILRWYNEGVSGIIKEFLGLLMVKITRGEVVI